MSEWIAIGIGALVAGLSLFISHHAFWGKGHPIKAYIIGTFCLDLGSSVTGAILQNWLLVFTPWIVAAIGGAVVIWCWWRRGEREGWQKRDRDVERLLEGIEGGTARKPRT
jgi:hypothetical protein